MNKKFIWLFVGIFLVALVADALIISIDGSITDTVMGSNASIVLSISARNIDTSERDNSSTVYSNNFVVNKNVTMNVTINETFTDNSNGSCSGGQADCSVVYKIINDSISGIYAEIVNGSPITFAGSSLDKNVSIEMTCVAYSCPQNRSIEIYLIEA